MVGGCCYFLFLTTRSHMPFLGARTTPIASSRAHQAIVVGSFGSPATHALSCQGGDAI